MTLNLTYVAGCLVVFLSTYLYMALQAPVSAAPEPPASAKAAAPVEAAATDDDTGGLQQREWGAARLLEAVKSNGALSTTALLAIAALAAYHFVWASDLGAST